MKAHGLLMMVVAGAAISPLGARAADQPWDTAMDYAHKFQNAGQFSSANLSLDPYQASAAATTTSQDAAPATGTAPASPTDKPVLTLDAGGTASRIHGFGDFRIATQYITPRGLVAEEDSPQFQALVGLVFDIYHGDSVINDISLVAGTWGDFNTHPDKSKVTGADIWVEQDIFGGVSVKFLQKWQFDYTIQAWMFPDLTNNNNEIDPTTEYNMDFKFSFDDSEYLKDFALHPYVDVFWNFAGASSPVAANVLLGKNDNTFYVEFGVNPSYTFKGISELPITFSFPTYFSVGDSSFWGETAEGDRSNFGIVSTGVKISVPLKFIPQDFGNWNAYIGMTYFHTCNPGLTAINRGTGADSNLVLGYAGVGFGF